MRVLANLFLILFLADGGFSLVDELVSLLTPLMPFTAFRNLLAGAVILMSVPVYLCLGIDRRLPKRIFLPLIFFVFWSLISTWLVPVLVDFRMYGLLISLIQVLLGMLPFYYFRNGNERSLTLPPQMSTRPFFSFKNTLIFSAANLLVVPLALLLLVLTVADAYMAEHSAGFIHLAPAGLKMTERVYKRDDNRTVRLAAMIHVGNKGYYEELAKSASAGRMIVLAEGVTDDDQLLKDRIDYGRVAGLLGLTTQDKMLFRGRLIDEDALSAPQLELQAPDRGKRSGEADILRADVDISEFRPATLTFLDAIGKHLRESPSVIKGVLALNRWAEKNITPEMYVIIMDDILHRRNMVVISHLDKALARYDTVVIPWGALHMQEIEAEVLKRGFVLQNQQQRISIDFRKMLTGRL